MPTDPTRVQAAFVAAAELTDPNARAACLDRECAGDTALRARVEALLKAHDQPDSMLDSVDGGETQSLPPAHDPDVTQVESADDARGFLVPSTRPGAIGRLHQYEILAVLGRGGFGTVYRAFDEKLHRVVAVKVLAPELAASGSARARFLREARSAAAVRDDHVINIHDVGEQPIPYLVMEYVAGQTLQEKLDKTGSLPATEVLRIGSQIARGLAAAHAQGLIHRDIKPANILLENGVERVKITDFGLARAADDASISQSGVVAGTPMYMSPEQAQGSAIDHRADLFSLGSVLYALCTGRPPFRGESALAVLKRVVEDRPRPVREIHPDIPDWLEAIISKLHAKDPADRFQSAVEVAELLQQHLAHLQQPATVPMPAPVALPTTTGSHPWTQILEATDRVRRFAQIGFIGLGVLVLLSPLWGVFRPSFNLVAILGGLGLLAVGGRIKQRCTVAYKGRLLRFENSSVTGRLFIDDVFVAGGRTRAPEDLTAVVPDGPGAGDQIRVSAHAGLGSFECRIFAAEGPAGIVPARPLRTGRRYLAAVMVAALAVFIAWVGPWAVRYARGTGRVEVVPAEGWVSVIIHKDGAAITDWHAVKDAPTIELTAGKYKLEPGFAPGRTVLRWEIANHDLFGVTVQQTTSDRAPEFTVHDGERVTIRADMHDDPTPLPPSPGPSEGWVSLFSGKDLTGWKNHPDQPGTWKVEGGHLVGRGRMGFLYSDRGDFGDFDLHVEAKVNDGGYGGVFIRVPDFPPIRRDPFADPKGHRVVMSANSKHEPSFGTGSMKTWTPTGYMVQANPTGTPPSEWFTLDILTRGSEVIVRVNGKQTAQIGKVAEKSHQVGPKGHLVLETQGDDTVIEIRKIEIRELPAE